MLRSRLVMRVLNSRQMREADRRAIEDLGIPSLVLMENAGRQVVAALDAEIPHLSKLRVSVLCGKGNNGGDGFVVSRLLRERGIDVRTHLLGRADDVKGDARVNLDKLRALGATVAEIADGNGWERDAGAVLASDLIVDALFGTGLNAPLSGLAKAIVETVNGSGVRVVSIDLPSGLSADSAEPIGPAIDATLTVTLAAPKLPLVLPPAESLAGKVVTADIGIPAEVIANGDGPWIELVTPRSLRTHVKPRAPDSHKGTYGRVLVVAGSPGKTGAAHLCAMAALRSGAGLVTVATPKSCLPIIAAMGAEYMTEPIAEHADGSLAAGAADRILEMGADVIAIGPGLGQAASTKSIVQALVERARVPLVVDADGLNAFVGHVDRLRSRADVPVVVTPHPGEMARLIGVRIEDVQTRRLDIARDFAVRQRLHVVLKGHRTLTATPAGNVFINPTGNPGMATGGTGDVLTGAIAAWIAQLREVEAATTLAVYLHGAAGDLAAADEGETGMIAGDVVARLPRAVLDLTGGRKVEPPAP